MQVLLTFGQEALLQLIGPVAAALLGTLILGGVGALISRNVERARMDKEIRRDFLARISTAAYAGHARLEDHARWVKHHRPDAGAKTAAVAALRPLVLADRIQLGALQNEVDAYFGDAGPGVHLHRLIDLVQARRALLLEAPESERREIAQYVAGPRHSGLDSAELADSARLSTAFDEALHATLDGVMRASVMSRAGFRSARILTGT